MPNNINSTESKEYAHTILMCASNLASNPSDSNIRSHVKDCQYLYEELMKEHNSYWSQ